MEKSPMRSRTLAKCPAIMALTEQLGTVAISSAPRMSCVNIVRRMDSGCEAGVEEEEELRRQVAK